MLRLARQYAIVGLGLALVGAVGTAVVRYVSPAPFITGVFGFTGATMVGFLISDRTFHPAFASLWLR